MGGEQICDDIIEDSETETEVVSPLPSPPTPPRPCPVYQTFNIIADDVEGVDIELYYSDVEPDDEDEEDLDVNMSSDFPRQPNR